MSEFNLTTPVLFLVFNRPDTTIQVFEAIRQAKPKQLFVAADGPRADQPHEEEKCEKVRQIATNVDWDCEVKTLFREKNLGCGVAVSSAIDWFFENVEEGIILEDDCLPHPTFFRFCQELLERYCDDERIMTISGDNFQFGRKRTEYSYYFSIYFLCWGWATWRRSWNYFDMDMKLWPKVRDERWLFDIFGDSKACKSWSRIFESVYNNDNTIWDYQMKFACWINSGLSILPNGNLVSNIGFREDGTHTKGVSKVANLKTEEMHFPLKCPPFVLRDNIADDFLQRDHYDIKPLLIRAIRKFYRLIKNI